VHCHSLQGGPWEKNVNLILVDAWKFCSALAKKW